jgi:hypothetical protein
MMIRMLSMLCLGALTLVADISMPQPVAAQSLQFEIGPGAGFERGRRRGRCDPQLARRIARSEGLRRPRVINVTNRRVVVSGRSRFGRDRMVFANRRGCPIIG